MIISGTSFLGGGGDYGSTVVGALVLTVLTSLLIDMGISFAAQQAVVGLPTISMVALYGSGTPNSVPD